MLLEYDQRSEPATLAQTVRTAPARDPSRGQIGVGLVGAGAFAEATHIPNLTRLRQDFELRAVMSRTGSTAKSLAARNDAAYATTDFDALLGDDDLDLILIATRHDLHASLALRALAAGKNVFVEKPLALTEDELEAIESFYRETPDGPMLMTGFNRRFSPAVRGAQALVRQRSAPLVVDYRMNAGYLPLDHWVHGPEGGGRNIGEACHVYDVFDAIVGGTAERITASGIKPTPRLVANDNFATTISYSDGSICTLTYTRARLEGPSEGANGDLRRREGDHAR